MRKISEAAFKLDNSVDEVVNEIPLVEDGTITYGTIEVPISA